MSIKSKLQALGLGKTLCVKGFTVRKFRLESDGFVYVIVSAAGFDSQPMTTERAAEWIASA